MPRRLVARCPAPTQAVTGGAGSDRGTSAAPCLDSPPPHRMNHFASARSAGCSTAPVRVGNRSGRVRRHPVHAWGRGDPRSQRGPDRKETLEEGTFVVAFAPQPPGDFVVALARVARAAGWGDVVERVAPAARKGQNAVPLQRPVGRTAVRTSAPRSLQGSPLLLGEVVLDTIHSSLASTGCHSSATSVDRHSSSVGVCLVCITACRRDHVPPQDDHHGNRPTDGSPPGSQSPTATPRGRARVPTCGSSGR